MSKPATVYGTPVVPSWPNVDMALHVRLEQTLKVLAAFGKAVNSLGCDSFGCTYMLVAEYFANKCLCEHLDSDRVMVPDKYVWENGLY